LAANRARGADSTDSPRQYPLSSTNRNAGGRRQDISEEPENSQPWTRSDWPDRPSNVSVPAERERSDDYFTRQAVRDRCTGLFIEQLNDYRVFMHMVGVVVRVRALVADGARLGR
jgi:hypothetical protein